MLVALQVIRAVTSLKDLVSVLLAENTNASILAISSRILSKKTNKQGRLFLLSQE
jgi:hypothetical protein